MGFEQHIRPFETPNVSPPRRSPTATGASPGPIQAIVGGTPRPGDQIIVDISHALLPGGQVEVTYTVAGGDNLQNVATGIVNAINATSSLAPTQITATTVAGQPFQFEVDQPATLQPQATIVVSATGALSLQLSNGAVQIAVAKDNRIKTSGGSHNQSDTKYTHKWPKEMTFQQVLDAGIPFRSFT